MKTLISLAVAFAFIGCASSRATVWERIGEQDETPKWTYGEKTMQDAESDVFFIHVVSTPTGQPEGCLRVAEEGARARVLRHIKDSMTNSGQTSESGLDNDSHAESLTTWLAAGSLQGVTTEERYWERVVEKDPEGKKLLKLRCAAKVKISKVMLERQIKSGQKILASGKVRAAQEKRIESLIENPQE